MDSSAKIPTRSFCDLARAVCIEAADSMLSKQEIIKLMDDECKDEKELQAFILRLLEKINVSQSQPEKVVFNVNYSKNESNDKEENKCFNCGEKNHFAKNCLYCKICRTMGHPTRFCKKSNNYAKAGAGRHSRAENFTRQGHPRGKSEGRYRSNMGSRSYMYQDMTNHGWRYNNKDGWRPSKSQERYDGKNKNWRDRSRTNANYEKIGSYKENQHKAFENKRKHVNVVEANYENQEQDENFL